MKDYEIVGGYVVKLPYDKEDVLDVLINVMSSKGLSVQYSIL